MRKINSSTFVFGFIVAMLVAIIFWYYQKSTSAEDGALDLLDRYAELRARLRKMEASAAAQASESAGAQAAA